jgi:tRNA (adenine37-N6)-methyltransferase
MARWFEETDVTSQERTTTRWFRVQTIGYVRRPGAPEPDPEAFYDPWHETALEILPRWDAALDGIEGYSHLLVIFWLDRVRRVRKAITRRPEGRAGMPEIGLFATRTPHRPNPLGISVPRLLRREGTTLWVTGIDAWPGTPILDLKGYTPRDDLHAEATIPAWLETLWATHDAERGKPGK